MTTCEDTIVINRPVNELIPLFKDTKHYVDWQPHLVEYETFEGEPGEEGAKARLRKHREPGNDVKMKQTVLTADLPEEYRIKQDTDGVIGYNSFHFEDLGERTQIMARGEYDTEGLMRLVDFFNPKYFDSELKEYLENFKNYAEK